MTFSLWAYAIASATAMTFGRRAMRSLSVAALAITLSSGSPVTCFIA